MSNLIKRNYISDSIKNPMQMIQSVHNEQSDKKKPVQTKVHMSKHDDMWLRARFFPLRKAVACPVPTHPSKVPMGKVFKIVTR